MKHMKCLFLTIFLDCSWLWKQGLKSFLLALQVRLLNGMFTYCWELFDSLCWYPVFLITEFLLGKLRHLGWLWVLLIIRLGWDGWELLRMPWSSLTLSWGLACSSLWLVLMAQEARSSSSRHMASAVPSSYSPCLRPSCYLCDGLGSHNMFWHCCFPPCNELVDSGESVKR